MAPSALPPAARAPGVRGVRALTIPPTGAPTGTVWQLAPPGKPVVGSLDCGAEDAIQDGINGLLAPQGDPAAVAQRILRLLDDPVAARGMGERGRTLALARDWSRVVDEYLTLYEQALGR